MKVGCMQNQWRTHPTMTEYDKEYIELIDQMIEDLKTTDRNYPDLNVTPRIIRDLELTKAAILDGQKEEETR